MRKLLFIIGILTFFLSSCGSTLEVTVNFDTNGGTQVPSQVFNEESVFTLPNEPSKEGHTFLGWFLDATLDTPFSVEGVLALEPEDALTVYASWQVNQYTITFDTDGGSAVSAITQDYATSITAPSNPTKEGYTFNGWSASIPSIMPAENTTLKATWTINQYTITFKDFDENILNEISIEFGSLIDYVPIREGYTFEGWYLDDNKTNKIETVPALDVTLIANWIINQYTITFEILENEIYSYITEDYNSLISEIENPEIRGYTFLGWDQNIPVKMPSENITIKAIWRINQYTIVFKDIDGSIISEVTNDYKSKIENNPTREGYTFEGWYLDDTLKDVYNLKTIPYENLTLYANWVINEYIVEFMQGETVIKTVTKYYDETLEDLKDLSIYLHGYHFSGWLNEIPDYMPSMNIKIFGDYEFYLKYSIEDDFVVITGLVSNIIDKYNIDIISIPNMIDNKIVKVIGANAFRSDTRIIEVIMQEDSSITTIGESAFRGAYSLEKINIPSSVKYIEDYAFHVTSNLSEVIFQENSQLESIGRSAFGTTMNLSQIVIPASVKYIGDYAFSTGIFSENPTYTEIIIEENSQLTSLGKYAFSDTYIEKLLIPSNLLIDDFSSIVGINGLIEITVDSNNVYYTTIDGVLFDLEFEKILFYPREKIQNNYVIPDTVTEIGDFAFNSTENLFVIEIPNNVTRIGDYAFAGSNIERIKLPEALKTIDENAFRCASNITSISFPKSLELIGNDAFSSEWCFDRNLMNLKEIIFADNSSLKYIGANAFNGSIKNLTSLVIPSSVESIEAGAFYGAESLTNLIMNEGLKYIGEGSFSELMSLTNLIIPSSVDTIGERAFSGAENLLEIIINEGVKNIGEFAFSDSIRLSKLIIPSSIISISETAFYGAINITELENNSQFDNDKIGLSYPYLLNNRTNNYSDLSGYSISSYGDFFITRFKGKNSLILINIKDPDFRREITNDENIYSFGSSISMYGDYIVVGAYESNFISGLPRGSVYVFKISDPSYIRRIESSEIENTYFFGFSVSINENYIAVGSYAVENNLVNVFLYKVDDYRYEQKIVSGNKLNNEQINNQNYGEFRSNVSGFNSIKLYKDYIVVGAYLELNKTGIVYVYKISDLNYERKIEASDGTENSYFGFSISIYSDYILVGAHTNNSYTGAVYLYKLSDPNYERKIEPTDGIEEGFFGYSVDIKDNFIVVGSKGVNSYTQYNGAESGKVYIYKIDDVVFEKSFEVANTDEFGFSVSISNGFVLIGARDKKVYLLNLSYF